MTGLPRLHYLTSGLPLGEGAAVWREVLSPLFEPRSSDGKAPVGSATGVIIGDMIVARVAFTAQAFVRDQERVRATPDHLLFHLYRSGGFSGLITRQDTTIWPGQVAIIDLGCEVRTRSSSSDTLSLIIPRRLLGERGSFGLPSRLDPRRNRLLAAHITSLWERSTDFGADHVPDTVQQTVTFVCELLAEPMRALQVDGWASERDLLSIADDVVRNNLASPRLGPTWLASEIGASRATLYRLFTARGGIKRYIQERRLLAVQSALRDPLEQRKLSRLAADFGFNSEAHFSRSFRARFGVTATDFRREQRELAAQSQLSSPDLVKEWWIRTAS